MMKWYVYQNIFGEKSHSMSLRRLQVLDKNWASTGEEVNEAIDSDIQENFVVVHSVRIHL